MAYKKLSELKSGECKFPIGDPKSPDFGFCGEKVNGNRIYCDKHAAECYRSPNRYDEHLMKVAEKEKS